MTKVESAWNMKANRVGTQIFTFFLVLKNTCSRNTYAYKHNYLQITISYLKLFFTLYSVVAWEIYKMRTLLSGKLFLDE